MEGTMSTRHDGLLHAIDRWTARLDELLELEAGTWLAWRLDSESPYLDLLELDEWRVTELLRDVLNDYDALTESIDLVHLDVPAMEEVDLLEEVRAAELDRLWEDLYAVDHGYFACRDQEDRSGDQEENTERAWIVTPWQAIAYIEITLGGTVIDQKNPGSTPT
jgi:hypothetical protein